MKYPEYMFDGYCIHTEEDSFSVILFDHICAWSWVTIALIIFI